MLWTSQNRGTILSFHSWNYLLALPRLTWPDPDRKDRVIFMLPHSALILERLSAFLSEYTSWNWISTGKQSVGLHEQCDKQGKQTDFGTQNHHCHLETNQKSESAWNCYNFICLFFLFATPAWQWHSRKQFNDETFDKTWNICLRCSLPPKYDIDGKKNSSMS